MVALDEVRADPGREFVAWPELGVESRQRVRHADEEFTREPFSYAGAAPGDLAVARWRPLPRPATSRSAYTVAGRSVQAPIALTCRIHMPLAGGSDAPSARRRTLPFDAWDFPGQRDGGNTVGSRVVLQCQTPRWSSPKAGGCRVR